MIWLPLAFLWLTIGLAVPGMWPFAMFSVVFFVMALNDR